MRNTIIDKNNNLLTITDTNLVKKTDKIKELMLSFNADIKPECSCPVYKVRLDMLHYNPDNYHIASAVASYEAKHGQGTLEEFCKSDTKAYNKLMDALMANSKNNWLERNVNNYRTPYIFATSEELSDDLSNYKLPYAEEDELEYFMSQGYTAITLSDGMILDGNFRFLKLRQQQEKIGEPLYLNTIILDKEADAELIKELVIKLAYEGFNSYACSRCNNCDISAGYWWYECKDCRYRHTYDTVDIAMAEYRAYQRGEVIPAGDEYDEVTADRSWMLELAKLYVDFLDYIGFAGDYSLLKETGLGYIIDKMRTIHDDDSDEEKLIRYSMILMKTLEGNGIKKDYTRYVLSEEICEKYFLIQLDISKDYWDRYKKAEIKTARELKAFVTDNYDVYEKTIQNIEAAYKFYYWTKLKDVSVTEGNVVELELSVRAYNCLNRAGIKTVAQLIKMDEESLKKVRNMGSRSLGEVMDTIKHLKLINGIKI